MEKKNVLYVLFLVGLMAVFALVVWAESSDELEGNMVNTTSPANGTNYTGSLLLNASIDNGSHFANATNVTFAFYDSDGALAYNVTLTPRINETFGYEFTSANADWYLWSNITYNLTIETSDTNVFASDGVYSLVVNVSNGTHMDNITNDTFTDIQIDNTNASVVFNSPLNDTFYSLAGTSTILFNISVTDSGVGVDDINITNLTTLEIGVNDTYSYQESTIEYNTSGDYFNITFKINGLADGAYYVNASGNDTLNNANDTEFVVVYVDNTDPEVIIGPGTNHIDLITNWTWTDDRTPDLVFNFTDGTSPNGTCTLHIDGTVVATNLSTNVLSDGNVTFRPTSDLDIGTHFWGVNCTDLGSNTARSSKNYTIDINELTATPANNTWTDSVTDLAINGTEFTFSFSSGLINDSTSNYDSDNNVSCELWMTNASGIYVGYGVNTSVVNATSTTIKNNQSLLDSVASPNGGIINWTINCTYNGTQITVEDNRYRSLYVDNKTVTVSDLASSGVTSTTASLSATTSEIASCRYSTDSSEGWEVMDEFETTGETSHSHSLSGLSSGTTYTYYVQCRDRGNLRGSSEVSFTTDSVAGGGGGGGSGGGISSAITSQFSQMTWASINAGETATLEVTNGEIGVTQVSFAIADTTYGAWVKVQKVDDLPSGVDKFGGKAYKNIKISQSNVEKAMKDKAKIKFKVAKSWLIENKVGRDNIVMYRFVDGKWSDLETSFNLDDGTYIHYTAETPGFSYFVIGEKVGAVPVEATEEVIGEAVQEAAIETPIVAPEVAPTSKAWLLWLIPVIVALAIIGWLVWFRKR